jgi:hypothetical protein
MVIRCVRDTVGNWFWILKMFTILFPKSNIMLLLYKSGSKDYQQIEPTFFLIKKVILIYFKTREIHSSVSYYTWNIDFGIKSWKENVSNSETSWQKDLGVPRRTFTCEYNFGQFLHYYGLITISWLFSEPFNTALLKAEEWKYRLSNWC